jgi:hypothetical protein
MHGPTGIVWTNLTPFSLQVKTMYSTLNILGTILFLPTGGHVGDAWGRNSRGRVCHYVLIFI